MEKENNIKGVGLKALFSAYVESDAPRKEPASSKLDEMFRNIWAKLDSQEKNITDDGKKQSSKKRNKGMQAIQMKQTPTLEKNVSSKELDVKSEEIIK